MKIRLILLFTLLSFVGFSQETPPTPGVNFKQLSTSQFWISLPDSSIWQYKGAAYGWQQVARNSDLDTLKGKSIQPWTLSSTPLNGYRSHPISGIEYLFRSTINNNTSEPTLTTGDDAWTDLGSNGLSFPQWNNSTSYPVGELVQFFSAENVVYRSKSTEINHNPENDLTHIYWDIVGYDPVLYEVGNTYSLKQIVFNENDADRRLVSNAANNNYPLNGQITGSWQLIGIKPSDVSVPDATSTVKGKIQLAGDLSGTADLPTVPGLTLKENTSNKQNSLSIDGSGIKYPTVDAINERVQYVTPQEFGAISDGINDASIGIQDAINNSKSIFIPSGIYKISETIFIPSNKSIIIDNNAILRSSNGLNKDMFMNSDTISGNTNIHISGGKFIGNAINQAVYNNIITFKKVDSSSINNLIVEDALGDPNADDGAISLLDCRDIRVIGVKARYNYSTGILSLGGTNVFIMNGDYSDNIVSGITTNDYGAIVSGNTAQNNGSSGISVNGFHNSVYGNISRGNQFGINIGHDDDPNFHANYSMIHSNIVDSNYIGIQIQANTINASITNNHAVNNTFNYTGLGGPSADLIQRTLGIRNNVPSKNALINLGTNFNTVPPNTAIVNLGSQPFRWTGDDGNADQGAFIDGTSSRITLGTRTGTVDADRIVITPTYTEVKNNLIGVTAELTGVLTVSSGNGMKFGSNDLGLFSDGTYGYFGKYSVPNGMRINYITGDVLFSNKASVVSAPTNPTDVVRLDDLGTGWAQYNSNTYTLASPLVISSGATTSLPNNGSTSITNQLPIGVTSFLNTTTGKITPQLDGDFYNIEVRFKAKSSSPNGRIKVAVNIGGVMGIIREKRETLSDGVGVEQLIAIPMMVYSGSTFVANGGSIDVTSLVGDTSIYDITFVISRTHKAK